MARNRKLCNFVVGYMGGWIAGAIVFADASLAQNIILDGTLGPPGGILTGPLYAIPQAAGLPVGNALLHSFEQFSLILGETANFETLGGITTILARVTRTPSDIDGQIQAQANLFLMNPNGIVFGPNARLNIAGSFVATTADAIDLGGALFSANPALPLPAGLLNINPNAFLFNQIAKPIINRSITDLNVPNLRVAGLGVTRGKSLVLVGGEILLENGGLFAPGGRIELASMAGLGTVGLNMQGDRLSLTVPAENRADITFTTLTQLAGADVRADDRGDIVINARNLTLAGGSFLATGIAANSGFDNSVAGDLQIHATGTVTLTGAANLIDRSAIINAVGLREAPNTRGKIGNIDIRAGVLRVEAGARIFASTFGEKDAGNITIQAREIEVTGSTVFPDGRVAQSQINSEVLPSATGRGGTITIKTDSLQINHGAFVTTNTSGQGNAGNIDIQAPNGVIRLDGVGSNRGESRLTSDTGDLSDPIKQTGAGGNVTINTQELRVQNGARVSAESRTDSAGPAGTLTIQEAELVQVDGAGSEINFNTSSQRLEADAGSLQISTNQLVVQNGGRVSARTSGAGDAGRITVTAPDSVIVDGAGSGLFFDSSGSGNAQPFEAIKIETGQLVVQNRGQVNVSGTGQGNPGNLAVNAGSIFLNNQGKLIAETRSGTGGNIQLQVRDILLLRFNSLISASAIGPGDGGNVEIQAPNGFILAVLSENSDIVASAEGGSGGRASGTAVGIYGFRQFRDRRTPESDFTASSEFGFDGLLEINTREEPLPEFLPVGFADPQVAQSCRAVRKPDQTRSEFVITGRGGLAATPDELLSSDTVEVDLVTRMTDRTAQVRSISDSGSNSLSPKIVEAQGWVVDRNGDILLVAQASTIHSDPWQPVPHCLTSHHTGQ